MGKLVRILSIDGGGIRGVIPGQILVSLEKKLRQATGNENARLAEYFDFIAGTNTGGILACAYLSPSDADPSKPRFSAEESVKLYFERGDDMFDLSLWQKIFSLKSSTEEKFSAKELEKTLRDFFGEMKLSQLLKPSLITAYDIRRRKAHMFRSQDARYSEGADFYVKDVARATSAAPTYFEVARIKSLSEVSYPLIDGGVFVNNPALCAFAEARDVFRRVDDGRGLTADDIIILSVGTGQVKKPYYYEQAKSWGSVGWINPLLDIVMSGVSESVDSQLRHIYDSVGRPEQYIRINPDLGDASPEVDDASPENLAALKEAGQYSAEEEHRLLDRVVEMLLKDHDKERTWHQERED